MVCMPSHTVALQQELQQRNDMCQCCAGLQGSLENERGSAGRAQQPSILLTICQASGMGTHSLHAQRDNCSLPRRQHRCHAFMWECCALLCCRSTLPKMSMSVRGIPCRCMGVLAFEIGCTQRAAASKHCGLMLLMHLLLKERAFANRRSGFQ